MNITTLLSKNVSKYIDSIENLSALVMNQIILRMTIITHYTKENADSEKERN